jgi:uncharacterized repeat protein (TIGR03803 family)
MIASLLLAGLSGAQTYQVVHNFSINDGATPYGGPILDGDGNLYGTTYLGGKYGNGSVYRLSPRGSSWKFTRLYSFLGGSDGSGPAFGSLAMGPQHTLFGTTESGGSFGTAYVVKPRCPAFTCPWKETVAHAFGIGSDGAQPIGGVVLDADGNFYGTTSLGGDFGNGTVFEAKRSGSTWTENVIYSFTGGSDGANPPAGVTLGTDGSLYGTSSFGGANGIGAVYKLVRSGSGWTEMVLYNFTGGDDGQNPVGGVILDEAGNLYGGTFIGGANGGGTVYELTPTGTLTTLYSFSGFAGGVYNKLTFDPQGNLYGATNADGANLLGSVFMLSPNNGGWTFTSLHDFAGGNDGASPYGSVAVDANGNVFGTAAVGGTNNQGLVFEITQ